jgi:hypothetical protein
LLGRTFNIHPGTPNKPKGTMNCGKPDKLETTRRQTIYVITAVNLIAQHTLMFAKKDPKRRFTNYL